MTASNRQQMRVTARGLLSSLASVAASEIASAACWMA
jgi:hypothetical protein